ncbi:hypothetical protein [Paenibacillus sp. YYML68]|uniref:hypothetical protein n=1 Tax=Paenibacillus sp. YYML68 TaxID=2909250 RepID=UPI00248F9015|nr:hypothetical protein [Paenibacillus sp. YYML68]
MNHFADFEEAFEYLKAMQASREANDAHVTGENDRSGQEGAVGSQVKRNRTVGRAGRTSGGWLGAEANHMQSLDAGSS